MIILSLFLSILTVQADELPTGDSSEATTSQVCISNESTLNSIMEHQSAHRKDSHSSRTTPHPRYGQYISTLRNSSGSEIIARLIQAETRAANCGMPNPEVQAIVTEGILNRLEKRFRTLYGNQYENIHSLPYQKQKELVLSVVFQNSQFASSLHRYRTSLRSTTPTVYAHGYKDFLCPPNDENWRTTRTSIDNFFRSGERTRNYSSTSVNYFLFQHSPRWETVSWANTLTESTTASSAAVRRCVRLYEEPSYR